MDKWKYGDVVRRAITMNPTVYQRVMYVGPAPVGMRMRFFVGVQLTEPPAPAVGQWVNPPPVGAIRKRLRIDLFELDPDD